MEEIVIRAIENFCDNIKNHIKLFPCDDPKFIRKKDKLLLKNKMVPVINNSARELPEYKELSSLISEDKIFKYGLYKIGPWCRVDIFIEWMINRSVEIRDKEFNLNIQAACDYVKNFRNTLDSKRAVYTLCQRILGLDMEMEKIELEEGVSIVRLSEDELNKKMPPLSTLDIGMPYMDLTSHHAEVRCSLSKNMKKIKSDLLQPGDELKKELEGISNDVFGALLLTKSGMIEEGPYSIKLESENGEDLIDEEDTILSQYMLLVFRKRITLGKEDGEDLKKSYRIARKISSEAEVLQAAMNRFMIGSKRLNPEDRLVDYIIAWEALLLTMGGKAGRNELSYRFALNGSTILYSISGGKITREEGLYFMKSVYNCRSMIVHGAGKKNLEKDLEKLGLSSVEELAEKVGEYLRKAILWFAEIDYPVRPYKEKDGWEKMLWEKPL